MVQFYLFLFFLLLILLKPEVVVVEVVAVAVADIVAEEADPFPDQVQPAMVVSPIVLVNHQDR